MDSKPQTLTATVEGRFGMERKVVLVRQPDGRYVEASETQELPVDSSQKPSFSKQQAPSQQQPERQNEHQSDTCHRLTARVQGQFGEDHEVVLVRQPDGQYRELTDTVHPMVL